MPKYRIKISAVYKDFNKELRILERFDSENQKRFSGGLGITQTNITRHQLHFLTEAVFFRAFRAYERFVRDIFLLYCQEKSPRSGARVISFLKPTSFNHSEELIKSSLRYLEWTNPDDVIRRSELYLKDGFPIKLPYATHRETLQDFRRIRNHIAHDSIESLNGYKVALRRHFGTIPLRLPAPGEFLLLTDRSDPTKYKLLVFFNLMKTISSELT